MRVYSGLSFVLVAGLALTAARAEDFKSGPEKGIGAFDVKAITGDNKGKQLCYV